MHKFLILLFTVSFLNHSKKIFKNYLSHLQNISNNYELIDALSKNKLKLYLGKKKEEQQLIELLKIQKQFKVALKSKL